MESFDICIHLCNHHHIKIMKTSITLKSLFVPLVIPPPQPHANTNILSVTVTSTFSHQENLHFVEFFINAMIQDTYLLFQCNYE